MLLRACFVVGSLPANSWWQVTVVQLFPREFTCIFTGWCALQVCAVSVKEVKSWREQLRAFLFTASQITPGVCSGVPVSPTLLCSQFFLQLFCLPAAPACRLVLNGPLAVVVVLRKGWLVCRNIIHLGVRGKGVQQVHVASCCWHLRTSMLKSKFKGLKNQPQAVKADHETGSKEIGR